MTETCLCPPGAQSPGDLCNNQKSCGKKSHLDDGAGRWAKRRYDREEGPRWGIEVGFLEEVATAPTGEFTWGREVQAAWEVILWWGRGVYGSLPRHQCDLCLGIMLLPVGEPSAGCSEEGTMGTLIPHSGPLSKGLKEGLQGLPGTATGACPLSSPCPPDPGGHH